MATLPGWAIDVIRDGVGGATPLTRREVHLQMRRVMLSAHRLGIGWPTVHSFLTDTSRNRLARQIETGRSGKAMTRASVESVLQEAWADTLKVVTKTSTRTRDDALNIIEEIREALEGSHLPNDHRKVIEAALTIACQKGTVRPTLPVRDIETMSGIPRMTVHRILKRLSEDGDWIRLARAGNSATRRANIYNLAPAIADTYRGATPPESQDPPKSHPPMSHPDVEAPEETMISLTPEELAVIRAMREGDVTALDDTALLGTVLRFSAQQDVTAWGAPAPVMEEDEPWSVTDLHEVLDLAAWGAPDPSTADDEPWGEINFHDELDSATWSAPRSVADDDEPWADVSEDEWRHMESRSAAALEALGRATAKYSSYLDAEFARLNGKIALAESKHARRQRVEVLKLVGECG